MVKFSQELEETPLLEQSSVVKCVLNILEFQLVIQVNVSQKTSGITQVNSCVLQASFSHADLFILLCQEMKCFSALENVSDYVASPWLSRPACFPADTPSLIAVCLAQFGGFGQSLDRESRQASEFRKHSLPAQPEDEQEYRCMMQVARAASSLGERRKFKQGRKKIRACFIFPLPKKGKD